MSSETEKTLLRETQRWKDKLLEKLELTMATTKEGEEILTNAKAYNEDINHFLSKKDYIRAFEAVIWAWAYLDIGLKFNMLEAE